MRDQQAEMQVMPICQFGEPFAPELTNSYDRLNTETSVFLLEFSRRFGGVPLKYCIFVPLQNLGTPSKEAWKVFARMCCQVFTEPLGRTPWEGRKMTFPRILLHSLANLSFTIQFVSILKWIVLKL